MTLFTLFQRPASPTFPGNRHLFRSRSRQASQSLQPTNLSQVTLGSRVRVTGFSPHINPEHRAHLEAYGIVPGRWLLVSQHHPVTVVQVDQTEIAMETGLAQEIQVSE